MEFLKQKSVSVLLFFLTFVALILYSLLTKQSINWIGLGLVCLFYFIIFLVGIKSSERATDKDLDSFLLAGRRLPLWIAMLTMAATWIGGGYINGTAEAAAESGLVWVQAPWGYGLSLIIGGLFFARKMRRYEFRTMLDPLERRFGSKATGIFFIPALLGEIFWIAAILTALGTTFSVIIGLDTQSSIIASAAIAIIYTAIGGLWSVAFTDIVQLTLLVFGLILVMPFILSEVGGIDQLWGLYQNKFGANASLIPNPDSMGNYFWNWLDYGFLLIFGGIPWQVYFQRVLAARTERTAMFLSIFAGFICIIVAVPAALIGMVGSVTDWSQLALTGPETNASILPYVFQHLTPAFVALIGLGAISAAVMSSIDSSMLSASTLSIWNVYRPLFNPSVSQADLQKLMKRAIIVVGVAATLLSLQVESVYALWFLCSDFVYCLLFPGLVCALFDPKANRIGALAGFVVAAILRFGGGDATLGIPISISYPMIENGVVLFPFRTLAMASSILTILIISRLTQHFDPPRSLR